MSWKKLALALVLFGVATAAVMPLLPRGTRSVRALFESSRPISTRFDRRQSAALFVGVREFDNPAVERVKYAVDDAIDLAYAFAMERRVSLVPPRRVILLLSGRAAAKKESQQRLHLLREANADVRFRAGAADIRAALRQQAALAGRDGLLIVSIATHGFLSEGNGYILGASSALRDRNTMLQTTDVFEAIASSAAQRSLVILDACRERTEAGTRSVLASATSAAPPIVRRLARTRGQAVFYAAAAGQWAYDDDAARNGVFTRALISGINCGAAKVRGVVTAETLAGYVERSVHAWIRDNRDPDIGSATQTSIDGAARNMPLAQCWGSEPQPGPARVTADGTLIRALSQKGKLLWQLDAGEAVAHVQALDLDADGRSEVIFTTRHAVEVVDDNGKPLWSVREPMTLTGLTTGDLFRQHANELVALWYDDHAAASHLTVYDPAGIRLGGFDHDRRFTHVTIGRPNNRSAPRVVATAGDRLFVFDPKKLARGKLLWSGRVTGVITAINLIDVDDDQRKDIVLATAGGAKIAVDFAGRALGGGSRARFERLKPRRSSQ
jgi:hypothetical protein